MACSDVLLLFFFDVAEESRDFLRDVIKSSATPRHETERLQNQSLLAGAEDWNALVDCARAVRRSRPYDSLALEGQDDLSYVWPALFGLGGSVAAPTGDAWEETDRLIALCKKLEWDAGSLFCTGGSLDDYPEPQSKKRRRSGGTASSHYWVDASGTGARRDSGSCRFGADQKKWPLHQARVFSACPASNDQARDSATALWSSRSTSSPYFLGQRDTGSRKRPPPGTISCIRFPPLSSARFGIVQEEMANDPFWLLMAVTFLIKTSGRLAIPALRDVKKRFPTPQQLCDAANEQQLSDMIRHLGLVVVRVAMIQKYARTFVDQPPRPECRFRVRNYEKREVAPSLEKCVADADDEAWEIGHMTQGRYALDSWRIFCRDVLLGRAKDWNGKGREAEFQPEWMRVMPTDKELRAYLRWMWMREGWEWDPATGERRVLREEMRRAVDEGRVEYDETGGLRVM
ncbi:hypothetical protein L249_6838 [Ophiocordyceps polyrhachis-furcata BCC 54312]|uniref:HhH-GPD domain-containing protein n=1 Tax=Ophiocordyceps polyrhachis-furcata BCC 54312 TaxID=1330021 RepID=A0A367LJM1_9HYPO|nr:hypothetical protein L249_6838 [Ophiocordyceps polyrhachis-furcata BCC 54312]